MEKPVHTGEDYCNNAYFDPSVYLNQVYPTEENVDEAASALRKWNRQWTDTFAAGTVRGQRLLDFGCGPSLNTVIPASRGFDEIYMSEYASQNRQAVQDWIDQKPTAYDWTLWSKLTAEKEGEGHSCEDIEARVRQRFQAIVPCDIHKDNPFDPEVFSSGFFDCITSSLCLEAACASEAEYKRAVKKLSAYLKPGGHLVMGGVLHQSFYPVGEHLFYSLSIRPDLLESASREAGFTDIKIDKFYFTLPEGFESDCAGFFFLKAIKL